MNIEKLDRIVINYEGIMNIAQWVQDNKPDTQDIPLNEGLLIIEGIEQLGMKKDMGIYFKASATGDSWLTIKQFDMSDMFMLMSLELDNSFYETGEIKVESKYSQRLSKEQLQKMAKANVIMLLDVFQYMTNVTENVVSSEETKQIKKLQKHKKKSGNNRAKVVKIKTTKYTFDFKGGGEGGTYERHAQAWTVRGHWRYMKKTGKRVWVKGYVKGAGIVETKTYKI